MSNQKQQKSKLNTVLHLVCNTVCIFVILAFVILTIVYNVTGNIGGESFYVIRTNSMEPTLPVYSVVHISEVPIDTLKEEDIITFLYDVDNDNKKDKVTHYLYSIEKKDDGHYVLRTHAEGRDYPDSWVLSEDDFVGKYVAQYKMAGKFLLFLLSKELMIAAIVILIILVAYEFSMFKIKKMPEKGELNLPLTEKEEVVAKIDAQSQENISTK
ncbi:MAG: signal peptidase I [Clostridia bacterium]